MREVAHEFVIDVPHERAWELLRDLTLASKYVPMVFDARIDTEQTEGVGTSRTVFSSRKPPELQETVTEWDDGKGFLLQLHIGDKPIAPIFRENYFRYAIEPSGSQTRATLAMSYGPAGAISALLCRLLVERQFRKELPAIAANMKTLYEAS